MTPTTTTTPDAALALRFDETRNGTAARLLRHRNVRIGGVLVLIYILVASFGPLIWRLDPYAQDLLQRLKPPMWNPLGMAAHPLGTDALGRDILARLLEGARVSLTIGFGAATIGAMVGVTLGAVAGYFGKMTDHVVMFGLTCKLALPTLLLAMTLIYFIKPSLMTVVCVIGLLHWSLFLVVTRSATQRIREFDYVKASRLAGASVRQIISWDILPNIAGPLLVVFTSEIAVSILAEAALSFLGVGVPSPIPSWGLMIAEGKQVMFMRPWTVGAPGLALFLLVVGVNLLGDGLRDAFSPQTRH
ncbi:ABC transporter permease [Achromobacter aloeverae]